MTRLHPRGGTVAVSCSGGSVPVLLPDCTDHGTDPSALSHPIPHAVQAAAAMEEKPQCQEGKPKQTCVWQLRGK